MIYTFVILCHPARYLRCSAENINEKKQTKNITPQFFLIQTPPKKKPWHFVHPSLSENFKD